MCNLHVLGGILRRHSTTTTTKIEAPITKVSDTVLAVTSDAGVINHPQPHPRGPLSIPNGNER